MQLFKLIVILEKLKSHWPLHSVLWNFRTSFFMHKKNHVLKSSRMDITSHLWNYNCRFVKSRQDCKMVKIVFGLSLLLSLTTANVQSSDQGKYNISTFSKIRLSTLPFLFCPNPLDMNISSWNKYVKIYWFSVPSCDCEENKRENAALRNENDAIKSQIATLFVSCVIWELKNQKNWN